MDPVIAAIVAAVASQLLAELVAALREWAFAQRGKSWSQGQPVVALAAGLREGGQLEHVQPDGSVIRVTVSRHPVCGAR